MNFHLCNRAVGRSGALSEQNRIIAAKLTYRIEHSPGNSESIPVSGFSNLNSKGDRDSIVKLIAAPETKLITTSLGALPPLVVSTLRRGLVARAKAKAPQVYILACENEIKIAHLRDEIVKKASQATISDAALFVPCVVDRICREVTNYGNTVVVNAEEYGRLSLWHNSDLSLFRDGLPFQARVREAIQIEQSESHLEFTDRLKKWLINGPHLLLALNAYYEKEFEFEQFIQRNEALARDVLNEFATGCFHVCSQDASLQIDPNDISAGISAKIEEVLPRLANFPDYTTRIMHRFVRPTRRNLMSVQDFFRNMRYKVADPARAFYDSEAEMPFRICDTLLKLAVLIAKDDFLERR